MTVPAGYIVNLPAVDNISAKNYVFEYLRFMTV